MWFLSTRKTRRAPITRAPRGTFHPRFEALEDRCLLSAGALDPTFGNGGLVIGPNLGIIRSLALAVVVQADGKIVAGGNLTTSANIPSFALERFNADGTFDSSFGTGGVVQTVVGAAGSGISCLTLQSDGKIVAGGSASRFTGDTELALVRYNRNGSLDTSFGSGGIVLTTGFSAARAVAIQGDGKIDVADNYFTGSISEFTLARYNANGSLDKTFGSRQQPGIVVTPSFGGANGDTATALAIQSDGNILLVGYAGNGSAMAVARYTTKGQLDSSFGSSGTVTMAPPGSTASAMGVVVQNNGGIVAAGYSYAGTFSLTLARLTNTGQLDTTFGGSNTGFAINSNMPHGQAIAQAANGDLVVAGDTLREPTYDFGVAAFLPSGVPDTTFGTGGTTTTDFSGGNDFARAMAISPDGKVVAAGYTNPPGGGASIIALARFLPPDTKIGSFTVNPNPVTAGSLVTLTVSGILNSNPTSTISNVVFYLDSIGGTPLTVTLISNSHGTWTYSFDTTGLATGTHTLYAEAVDSNGIFSDPLAVTLTVN